MSEYECPHPECDESFDSKAGRGPHYRHSHPDKEIKEVFIEKLKNADGYPYAKKCKDITGFSARAYGSLFGSYTNALKRAGYEPVNEYNVSEEKLLEHLTEFADGKSVSSKKFQVEGKYSYQQYVRKFDSWQSALEKAGLKMLGSSSKIQITCDYCKEEFEAYEGRTFCSKECYGNYISENLTGENAPAYKDGINIERKYPRNYWENRKTVVERDGGCIVCGKENDLNCHHISPLKFFPEKGLEMEAHVPENMVILCEKHHGQLEGKWKGCDAERFKSKAKDLYE